MSGVPIIPCKTKLQSLTAYLVVLSIIIVLIHQSEKLYYYQQSDIQEMLLRKSNKKFTISSVKTLIDYQKKYNLIDETGFRKIKNLFVSNECTLGH